MKAKTLLFLLAGLMVISCKQKQAKLVYPKTEKKIVTDTYFGTKVEDPYRWLEDDRSPETERGRKFIQGIAPSNERYLH